MASHLMKKLNMAEIVKEDEFDKSKYYDENGEVIYCKDTEILIQGEVGGRGEETEMEDGSTITTITMGIYSGNLWDYKVREWPWNHAMMESERGPSYWGVKDEPADYFAHKYNFYCGITWVQRMPAEVAMFLLSRPFRLIPHTDGSKGLHAAIKIHDDPEKGKELIEALSESTKSYKQFIESSRKLGIHGYASGPRRPRTMILDTAVRLREKLEKIETQFNRIRWLEYNIRFRNNMDEWHDMFDTRMHKEFVADTARAFEKIGTLLGQEKLANEEEEDQD